MKELDGYLVRLESCKGRFVITPLNRLIDRIAADMATIADLADDDTLWDMSKRALVNAWKNGCVMYILNGQEWTRAMSDLVEWMVYHDLWSKVQVFSDLLKEGEANSREAKKDGPKNMLEDLPDTFSEPQLEALRVSLDKPKDAKIQLRVWRHRGFISYSDETGLYSKTQLYLKRKK